MVKLGPRKAGKSVRVGYFAPNYMSTSLFLNLCPNCQHHVDYHRIVADGTQVQNNPCPLTKDAVLVGIAVQAALVQALSIGSGPR